MRARAVFLGIVIAGGELFGYAVAGTSVGLTWEPSPDSVQGYNVYFGPSGGSQTNMVNVGNSTNVVLQGLDVGRTYFFFASAYSGDVQSEPSPMVTYTTPLNNTPTLAPIADAVADEGKPFQLKASASDPDVPAQTFKFSLGANAPAGASIDVSTGAFSWTPASSQAPSTNRVTITVTDSGTPAQSASQTFTILVREGFYLTVNSSSGGTVQVSPRGTLNQAGTKYLSGTQVSASAQASFGYAFDHWTLNGATYTANPLNFTMDQNQSLTPYFKLLGGVLTVTQSSPTTSTTSTSTTSTSTSSLSTTTSPTTTTTLVSTNQTTTNAVVLEASTNLVEWTEVAVAPTTSTTTVDTNVVYRVKTVPLGDVQ
jgi:hypothetical protein